MNRFIQPAFNRMVREWIRMYNANKDEIFRGKFGGIYKFMCDLDVWWVDKGYYSYKQELAINKLYHTFNLHLENGHGKTLTRSRKSC